MERTHEPYTLCYEPLAAELAEFITLDEVECDGTTYTVALSERSDAWPDEPQDLFFVLEHRAEPGGWRYEETDPHIVDGVLRAFLEGGPELKYLSFPTFDRAFPEYAGKAGTPLGRALRVYYATCGSHDEAAARALEFAKSIVGSGSRSPYDVYELGTLLERSFGKLAAELYDEAITSSSILTDETDVLLRKSKLADTETEEGFAEAEAQAFAYTRTSAFARGLRTRDACERLNLLGSLRFFGGDREEADACFGRVVETAPMTALALSAELQYAQLKGTEDAEEGARRLEEVIERYAHLGCGDDDEAREIRSLLAEAQTEPPADTLRHG